MLRKENILEIVFVIFVTVDGLQHGQSSVSARPSSTGTNMVESLRRQLMQNNYDYVEPPPPREPPAPLAAPAAPGPQPRARASAVQPTMRIQRVTRSPHRPTYSFSFTRKRELEARTPREPREPWEPREPPQEEEEPQQPQEFLQPHEFREPQEFRQPQQFRQPEELEPQNEQPEEPRQQASRQPPAPQKVAKDPRLPYRDPHNFEYFYNRPYSSGARLHKPLVSDRDDEPAQPLIKYKKPNSGAKITQPLPQLFNKRLQQTDDSDDPTPQYTYPRKQSSARVRYNDKQPIHNVRQYHQQVPKLNYNEESQEEFQPVRPQKSNKVVKKQAKVVHRQPYPNIDVTYKPVGGGGNPQTSKSKYNSDTNAQYSQRLSHTVPVASQYNQRIDTNFQFNQPPNIRVKYTIPTGRNPPSPAKPRKKMRRTKRVITTRSYVRSPGKAAIPESMWEEDGGPFEPPARATPTPRDAPLAKKYHFRADDDADSAGNSTVKVSVLKLKRKSGSRRSGAFRKILLEESAAGVALLVLDDEPLPEFRLPPPRAQYMQPSDDHPHLHPLD